MRTLRRAAEAPGGAAVLSLATAWVSGNPLVRVIQWFAEASGYERTDHVTRYTAMPHGGHWIRPQPFAAGTVAVLAGCCWLRSSVVWPLIPIENESSNP